MRPHNLKTALFLAVGALLLAFPMLAGSAYWLSYGINVLQYATLATAWAMFSGPTRYISLATVAFYGIGSYTAAVLSETLPWVVVLAVALVIGMVVAVVVGLSTLRLSGIYFVIFSFGLAELVRQLVIWYEVNVTKDVSRYIFGGIGEKAIYLQLAGLFVLVLATSWWIRRSRLGLALRVIGEDEAVARHLGVNTTRAKITLFVTSAAFMTLVGAVMAPRWTYIDPSIAFNPTVSFQVLIMALLGGVTTLLGPLAGVLPLTALFEFLSGRFPNHFSIMLGLAFLVIVYLVPNGVVHHLSSWWRRRSATAPVGSAAPAAAAAAQAAGAGEPLPRGGAAR